MPQHPRALVARYQVDFQQHIPLIRDGDAEGIHQGRVATRRLREGLRLLDGRHAQVEAALATARAVGRALGDVRELDVLADVLRTFELRLPVAAPATAAAAAALRGEQREARRRMIKSLDRIDLTTLQVSHGRSNRWANAQAGWQSRLVDRIRMLGSALEDVLTHASGVYLPNRSHRLRVVVKKLRYAVEAAADTGVWRAPGALAVLRRAQSRLGDLHDLHVAQRRMEGGSIDPGVRAQAAILGDVIAAEIERRQQRFLALRDDLASAAADCQRLPSLRSREAWARRGRTLLVAAVAVPRIIEIVSSALTPAAGASERLPVVRRVRR